MGGLLLAGPTPPGDRPHAVDFRCGGSACGPLCRFCRSAPRYFRFAAVRRARSMTSGPMRCWSSCGSVPARAPGVGSPSAPSRESRRPRERMTRIHTAWPSLHVRHRLRPAVACGRLCSCTQPLPLFNDRCPMPPCPAASNRPYFALFLPHSQHAPPWQTQERALTPGQCPRRRRAATP